MAKKTKSIKSIRFFDDTVTNQEFLDYFSRSIEDGGYDDRDELVIRNVITSLKRLVPSWDFQMACSLLDIGCLQVQYSKTVSHCSKGKEKMARTDAETLSRLTAAMKNIKEAIGIDPKGMAAKGESSMSEAFADVVARGTFQKKHFIVKPMFIRPKRGNGTQELEKDDHFNDATDEKLMNYLQKAGT